MARSSRRVWATPEETGSRPACVGKDRIITHPIGDETGWITARSLRSWGNFGTLEASIGCFHLLCFAKKYDVNLGWLITGETLHVGADLAKEATGKIAILPAMGPEQRRATAYQRQETIARRSAGVETLTDIARSFAVSHQTISRLEPSVLGVLSRSTPASESASPQ